MQVQAILAFGDENAFMRQRDARIGGIGDIGEKHALPNCGSLRSVHVLHVEHDLWESLRRKLEAGLQKKPASL